MIGKLISSFFNFLLSIIMSIIQLICLPLNLLFEGVFPDFTEYISTIQTGLNHAFNSLSWALSLIPPGVKTVLLFIFTIELSMLAIMRSSHLTARVWKLIQKLKFW